MSTLATVQQLNRDLADQLCEEAQQNPQSAYAGKRIGIANGQVVVADDWNEVAHKLRQAEADPARTFCVDTAADYQQVQEIWEIG